MRVRLDKRAVSTAITTVMFLSLVIALTAGVYVITTKSVNVIAPTAKAAFEKGEQISGAFSAAIEEGGLGTTPVIPEGYEYGDIDDLEVSIQKSPAYVKDIPGYFRVVLENPTSRVIRVPLLEISMKDSNGQAMDLSRSAFENIEVADRWGDANPIGFTSGEAGGYEIEVKIQDEERVAHLEVVSMEVAPIPEPEKEPPPNAGKVIFEVARPNTAGLEPCAGTLVTECDEEGSNGVRLDLGQWNVSVSAGHYAWGGTSCGGCGCRAPVYQNLVGSEGYYTSYYTCPDAFTGRMGDVRWSTTGVEAARGNPPRGVWTLFALSAFNSPVPNLMNFTDRLAYICSGKGLTDISESAGTLCPCFNTAKRWSFSQSASYTGGEPPGYTGSKPSKIWGANEPMCIKNTTQYSAVESDTFVLPNQRINAATLYLRPRDSIAVKARVNDEILTDSWLELEKNKPTTLDVTGIVAPGGIENTIEFWIDPRVGGGEYVLDWTVLTE